MHSYKGRTVLKHKGTAFREEPYLFYDLSDKNLSIKIKTVS